MRFVDLFAGTGGMRLGFEQACNELGIHSDCVFASEIDKKACETYRSNFGHTPHGDIRDVDNLPPFDFLLAGFPCQTFSYAGKHRGFGDTRGTLFFEVARLLEKHRPQAFLLENVRGLTTHDQGRTLQTILQSLRDLGYSVQYVLLNSSHFSVPQNRVRIYIVGILNDEIKLSLRSDVGAADSHKFRSALTQGSLFTSPYPYRTVRDILQNDVDDQYICTPEFVTMLKKVVGDNTEKLHGYRLIDYRGGKSIHSWELGLKGVCTPDEINFMNLLIANRRKKKFGTHQDGKSLTLDQIKTFYTSPNITTVTNSLLEKGYLRCIEGKYNPVCGNMSFEVFKFLDPDSISITLTASDANRLGIVHNGIIRRITPRECARLQGFPDSYCLPKNSRNSYKQLGNAVSVPVVKAVIQDIFEQNEHLREQARTYA